MPRQQATRARWSSWASDARRRRSARPTATGSGRFRTVRPGGRQSGRRGKQAGRKSPVALARGPFGALGKNKASTGAKRSRKGPALLAVLAGLGAAGAAAFKRRQDTRPEPQAAPVAPDATGETETPRPESV
jgi:hypothetical protein